MSDRVSSRHEGDLGGRFLPFGAAEQVGVTVEVPDGGAGLPSVQHTAWMLVNILARLDGVVGRVAVRCPPGVALAGRVVPLAPTDLDLAGALLAGGDAIGVVPVTRDEVGGQCIVVGPAARSRGDGDLFAAGGGWCGGVSTTPGGVDRLRVDSPLPFGPYVAASLAAAEVFKRARMRPGTYQAPASAYYSCWHYSPSEHPDDRGPRNIEVPLAASVVGVGAVGSGLLHCLWACPSLSGSVALIDHDPKGLEATNLNRYCIFGRGSIGLAKATAAARVLAGSGLRWEPHDCEVQSFRLSTPRVVSAVDRNSARSAIQNQYPARIFSGSTSDLRAEVLRCGPPGAGACLRCFNEPEKLPPDEELRSRLRSAGEDEVAALAESAGVPLSAAKEWLATGRCGTAGDRLLPLLRRDSGESEFAVGFVSVLAGTMLAAALLKDHVTQEEPVSEFQQRAAFQLFAPLARSNRAAPFRRDPACPMCSPSAPACGIWRQRYEGAAG